MFCEKRVLNSLNSIIKKCVFVLLKYFKSILKNQKHNFRTLVYTQVSQHDQLPAVSWIPPDPASPSPPWTWCWRACLSNAEDPTRWPLVWSGWLFWTTRLCFSIRRNPSEIAGKKKQSKCYKFKVLTLTKLRDIISGLLISNYHYSILLFIIIALRT